MSAQNQKLEAVRQMIIAAEHSLSSAKNMLAELSGSKAVKAKVEKIQAEGGELSGAIVEGMFDGEQMIDTHGKTYQVPANYSSKSKLVQGDTLKLTILEDGSFIYKQIGPVERKKVVGTLVNEGGAYKVAVGDKTYDVLYASVTYFRAKPGDKVTLIIPEDVDSRYGAIENVLPAVAAN